MTIVRAADYVEAAMHYARIKYREGHDNANKFSAELGRPSEFWCDDFVSGVALEVGALAVVGNFAYCPTHVAWFRQHGAWRSDVGTARAGDIGFILVNGVPGHVFIVAAPPRDGFVSTVEGNTNDDGSSNGIGVFARTRSVRSVYGFGRPDWPLPAVGADQPPAPMVPAPTTAILVQGQTVYTHWPVWQQIQVNQVFHDEVLSLQWRLNAFNTALGIGNLVLNGQFGEQTRAKVRAFQHWFGHGLRQDGIADGATAVALDLTTP